MERRRKDMRINIKIKGFSKKCLPNPYNLIFYQLNCVSQLSSDILILYITILVHYLYIIFCKPGWTRAPS